MMELLVPKIVAMKNLDVYLNQKINYVMIMILVRLTLVMLPKDVSINKSHVMMEIHVPKMFVSADNANTFMLAVLTIDV